MRRLLILLVTVFFTVAIFAQSPQKMSYQAVIRNSSDVLVANHAVGMKISILKDATPVYVETQTPTTNSNGLISIEIGGGNPVTGTFAGIDWSAGTYFIQTEIDPLGGNAYTITGTSQLLSVPYALYAKASESSTDAVKLTGNQTITGNKTFSGTTTVQTPVSATDAATKAYVDLLLDRIEILEGSIVKDVDGNVYSTVELGNQIWMAENLRTTHYRDGTDIPLITVNGDWFKITTPGYCWYNNDEATYKIPYGALYNWYAVNTENLCPSGWHVATDDDWTKLTAYAGGGNVAGGMLKEAGTSHWLSPNTGATNGIGFTALPGGARNAGTGAYGLIRSDGYWWSSTVYTATNSYLQNMSNGNARIISMNADIKSGFSVRCVMN